MPGSKKHQIVVGNVICLLWFGSLMLICLIVCFPLTLKRSQICSLWCLALFCPSCCHQSLFLFLFLFLFLSQITIGIDARSHLQFLYFFTQITHCFCSVVDSAPFPRGTQRLTRSGFHLGPKAIGIEGETTYVLPFTLTQIKMLNGQKPLTTPPSFVSLTKLLLSLRKERFGCDRGTALNGHSSDLDKQNHVCVLFFLDI